MENTKTLNKLRVGEKGCVESVSTSNIRLSAKLLTMGIVAGTVIEVLCTAPIGGDPIKIKARGYQLSLRISEAHTINVIPV